MKGHAFIRAEALLRSFANNPGVKAGVRGVKLKWPNSKALALRPGLNSGVKKRALAQTNDLIFTSRRKCKELRKRNEL
jgi:hypothetical protein